MTSPAPGWYADQANPQLLRWWDGGTWTPHTQPNPQAAPPPPQQQVQQLGGQVGAGPLYHAPELVIAQRGSFMGMAGNAGAYQIFDPAGTHVGTFAEPEESLASKALGGLNPLSDWKTKEFSLTDAQGTILLRVANPQGFKATLKPRFTVSTANGAPVGVIEQTKAFSSGSDFAFTVDGRQIGHFEQTTDRIMSGRFICKDGNGNQIAEFAKRRESFKEAVRDADSYALTRPNPIPEPLGSLVLISACALDATFHERKK